MAQQIWLVRHGETEWSRSGQHTGTTDISLTENGQRRARELAPLLAGIDFSLVLTSPLSRARETCRLAGLGDRAHITSDLMEWNYGVFEGRTTADIRREIPDWSIWSTPVPNGESVEEVGGRAARVIARTAEAHGNAALFAHGHILRILAACWLGLPANAGRLFALDTGSVSVLGFEHERRVMKVWNRLA